MSLFFWATSARTLECRAVIVADDVEIMVGPILIPPEVVAQGDDAVIDYAHREIPRMIELVLQGISQGEKGEVPDPSHLEVMARRLDSRFA